MENIKICEICGRSLKVEGLDTVIITDRHKHTKYYHDGCIERECRRAKKLIRTINERMMNNEKERN